MSHVPYICIGAFYSVQGGSLSNAKALLRKGRDEYDQAIAANKLKRMHRVSHRVCAPGSTVRNEIDKFVDPTSVAPPSQFPHLFIALLEYALEPVIERRIDEIHARILKGSVLTRTAQACPSSAP